MDWSDEVRARLADLLNVLSAGYSVIEAGNAADIRAALGEMERLRVEREAAVNGLALMVERAEAAEAELERLRWLGENWPAFWLVMPGWAQAEKYRAAIAALRGGGE